MHPYPTTWRRTRPRRPVFVTEASVAPPMPPSHHLLALAVPLALGLPCAPAAADPGAYLRCARVPGASLVEAARTSCAAIAPVARAVAAVAGAEEGGALRARGWAPLRAHADGARHDLVAVRGRGALRLRLRGPAPDLDGWADGRELVFAHPPIVGGRPIPPGAASCTSAFLVRLPRGSLGGLSAAHCAGLTRSGRVARRYAALRRRPQPGVVLGRVQRILVRSAPLDALLLPVPRGTRRTAVPVVDRGLSRPPWPVTGVARPRAGRRVCFTGRTSGRDRCGTVRGASSRRFEAALLAADHLELRCTTIPARHGDSGSGVYTAPDAHGDVRAVGLATLVAGPRHELCFTPVGPVLARLGATLVTTR